MKKILLLELEPEIKKNYLSYMIDGGFFLLDTSDNFDNDEIFGLVIRSKIIVNDELIQKYNNIKFVFRIGTGLDNVDLEICRQRGIKVFNSSGGNADTVADLAVWGTIALMRKLKDVGHAIGENRFDYMGNELAQKNVCLVGFGNIGKKIYERLLGFCIGKFYILDPFVNDKLVESYARCQKVENLDAISTNIDILYCNMPLNAETQGYINESLLSKLKNDVKIVNVARGGLINIYDLLIFLKKNKNAGAFLDVDMNQSFEDVKVLDNCIITPHIGAMTHEADYKMHQLDINNILYL